MRLSINQVSHVCRGFKFAENEAITGACVGEFEYPLKYIYGNNGQVITLVTKDTWLYYIREAILPFGKVCHENEQANSVLRIILGCISSSNHRLHLNARVKRDRYSGLSSSVLSLSVFFRN